MAKNNTIKSGARFEWAGSIVRPQAGESILEIGCGTGLWVPFIASSLGSGKLTAIDSSAAMIEKALKNNLELIREGRLELQASPFLKAVFSSTFDKIIAFNVNICWKGSREELGLLSGLLRPGGKLFVFYQSPAGIDLTLLHKIEVHLNDNGFIVSKKMINREEAVRSIGLIAMTR